ncbi:MAG: hypothetical protein V4509_01915 [Patescibacteria group bacterium]
MSGNVSVSPFNPVQQSGCRAKNPPDLVIASRAPTTKDYGYFLGTFWLYEGNSFWGLISTVFSPTTKSAVWTNLGGASGQVSQINGNTGTATPSAGIISVVGIGSLTSNATGSTDTMSLTGLTNHAVLVGAGTDTITKLAVGATGTLLAGATGADPAFTATPSISGNYVGTTAGNGFQFNANTATGVAASPIVLNSRAGAAVFTSVSIAAAADLTLTITNSAVTASTTQIIYSLAGATTGSALTIKSVTNSAGSSAVVVTNGTGATTSTSDITLTFLVVN